MMSDPVGKRLFDATENGHTSEVSTLLRDHPEIDMMNRILFTILHFLEPIVECSYLFELSNQILYLFLVDCEIVSSEI